jgi:MSHA biogenesis protein MshJ
MNVSMPPLLNRFLERIDALTLRERAILFVGVLAALFLLASNVVFSSLFKERARLSQELTAKRDQTRTLQTQIENIVAERGRNPDEINRTRIAELKTLLREREGGLTMALHGVVSPREMLRMIEQVLSHNRALTVVAIENLPAVPLQEDGTVAAAGTTSPEKTAAAGMYKHGLRIVLDGQYPDILRYLQSLERLPWKVLWGEVRLQTDHYPVSRVTLVIYTLSLDAAWIGV